MNADRGVCRVTIYCSRYRLTKMLLGLRRPPLGTGNNREPRATSSSDIRDLKCEQYAASSSLGTKVKYPTHRQTNFCPRSSVQSNGHSRSLENFCGGSLAAIVNAEFAWRAE